MTGVPRLVRFVLVGILNTGFSYGIYIGLLALGLEYRRANLLALLTGIVFSFKTQSALVFGHRNNWLLVPYTLGWAVVYLCSNALIAQFMRLGASAYGAGALALPFTTVLGYLLQRRFVFRRS